MSLKKTALYIASFLLLCGSSWGIWVQAGSDLNRDSLKNAEAPDLDFSSSNGFVTWSELAQPGAISAQQIYVKTWNGTDWQDVGSSLNTDVDGNGVVPRIEMLASNEPWITWEQTRLSFGQGIEVKRWNGSAWVSETSLFLNRDVFESAYRPTMNQNATIPYVAWHEVDGSVINRIHVSRHVSDWEAVGTTLNGSYTEHGTNPTVAMVGSTPYVAWTQSISGVDKVVVKRYTGTVWEAVGGTLNANTAQNAFEPQLVTISGMPWVTWHEATASGTNIYVKSWNGVDWQNRGGSLNISTSKNARYPHLTSAGSTPYIAWSEESGVSNIKQINVKYWTGSQWLDGGTSLNQSSGNHADRPRIGYWNDTVYVTWQEVKSGTSTIIVKHNVTPTSTSTATPTFTTTPTPSYTPTASPTVTPTYTSTVTPTQTETVTRTVTPTFTRTITPDWTHTATPTVTPTYTITLTATSSSTISPTTTATPSITLTYTKTPTASMTATPTITPYGISEDEVKAYPIPATGNDIWFYYEMSSPGEVTISIYDINGHKGEQLTTVHQSGGYQRTHWDISHVAPGIYIYRLEIKTASETKQFGFKKVVITREP